ncbi:MAG: metallophosphoesterase [Thermoguttaceae bacterium]
MVASRDYIENVLATFQRAVEVNRQTPGRQGSTVTLDSQLADEVMLTGDIHGHRRNFNVIRRIAALADHPRRHLVLQEICHGGPTYTAGGGCMSHTMLEDVASLVVQHPGRVHFILGNHELAELSDYPIQKNRQLLNLQFRLGLRHMYGPSNEDVRQAYLGFLWSCPLAVRLSQGLFVSHSLPEKSDSREFDPSVLLRELQPADCSEEADVFRMLWGRDYRRENAAAFVERVGAKLLVTGHEPCTTEGFIVPNDRQIILDCCGGKAAYVILPVGQALGQAEIIDRIQML